MSVFNQSRQNVIRVLFLVAFIILVIRLLFLQVSSSKYDLLALDNAVSKTVVYPDRGIIFDRKGRSILENTLTYDLMVLPNAVKNLDTAGLCKILNISEKSFHDRLIGSIIKNGKFRPSVFEAALNTATFVQLQENIFRFEPGFYLQERPIRSYPYKAAAHLLGYVGEVDSNILKRTNFYYQMGDYMGLAGLERYYEPILMGKRGIRYQVKDNKNRIVGSYENGAYDSVAVAGRNLNTYLDIELQVLAERLMKNKLGAIVAIEPKTGGILAMASGPTYDPNLLTGSFRKSNFSFMLRDTARPLFNRAIKGQYAPGSTIKPMGALIALDEGVITPSFGFACAGAYRGCNRPIACEHKNGGHAANLRMALANSCNSYFSHIYRMAVDNREDRDVRLGYARWKKYMNSFGMGVRLGLDLPSEDKGLITDTSFYDKLYNKSWNSCTNVFLGIGQGEMQATPLQMANLMCIIANKGYYYTPHFVSTIENEQPEDTLLSKFKIRHEVTKIPDTIYNIVQLGMQDVVDHGTAMGARIEGIGIAGKTGTAENYGIINGRREKLKNHSWFVCFAPRENPKIAIAVIVENAGFGATWATPMASLMLEKYLRDTLSAPRWKEVERIENTEIILPVVKMKRNRLDSMRREKLKTQSSRLNAKLLPTQSKNPLRKTEPITYLHLDAILKDEEPFC
ncbi:MAG: penicillin-binding protein 2 [Chitinophagia bacterium]|jgi:penicillin-binding protein 2|nr:penicillin-binding protein 2 [Chitinophagia bacterium]